MRMVDPKPSLINAESLSNQTLGFAIPTLRVTHLCEAQKRVAIVRMVDAQRLKSLETACLAHRVSLLTLQINLKPLLPASS